ncbi:MAG: hypothetical protein LBQ06_00220 [Frankiaceae bacterium]|nr:hypothetical protein [Frankiaceae bacterium]
MPIIHGGPAQMIIAGPETLHGVYPGFTVYNDSTDTEVYVDVTPNIQSVPGAPHYVIPPGTAVALTGRQTFWARTREGTHANMMVMPSATFGMPGTAAPAPPPSGG